MEPWVKDGEYDNQQHAAAPRVSVSIRSTFQSRLPGPSIVWEPKMRTHDQPYAHVRPCLRKATALACAKNETYLAPSLLCALWSPKASWGFASSCRPPIRIQATTIPKMTTLQGRRTGLLYTVPDPIRMSTEYGPLLWNPSIHILQQSSGRYSRKEI